MSKLKALISRLPGLVQLVGILAGKNKKVASSLNPGNTLGSNPNHFSTNVSNLFPSEERMKDLAKGTMAQGAISYEAKVEDGQIKISAGVSLDKLVDIAAGAIPGDSAIEQTVVALVKSAVNSI